MFDLLFVIFDSSVLVVLININLTFISKNKFHYGSGDNESGQFYILISYVILCRNFTLGFGKF